MTTGGRAGHLLKDELLDYFEGKLPDDRQRRVEEHVVVCDACTALARNVSDFNDAWEWMASDHGALAAREQLVRGLEAAAAAAPTLRDRLRLWRQRWVGLAEAGLRVAVQGPAAAVQVVAESLDVLARPGSSWRFTAIPPPLAARGSPATDAASALLGTAPTTAGPRARVAIRAGQSTEVEVRIDGLPTAARPPIVLLMTAAADAAPRVWVSEAQVRPGASYRIAVFSGLSSGEYVVAFEPLAAPSA